MKKLLTMVMALCLGVLLLSGCGSPASETEEPEKVHTLIDHAGREVTISGEVNRIVVCDIYPLPSILATYCGAGNKIVGMAATSYQAIQNGLLGELYPKLLEAKTDFIDGTTVNMESLLSLKPDVVFYNAGNQALGEQLTKTGFTAVAVSAGKWNYDAMKTLLEWVKTGLEVMGGGTDSPVYERSAAYNTIYREMVDERLADIPEEEKKSLFFVFQYTAASLVTAGNPSFGQYWADAIKAKHVVTEETAANSLTINFEQVYAWNPDVIFVTNFTPVSDEQILSGTVFSDDWSSLTAVRNGAVYKMPLGLYRSYTSGSDSPLTLVWMAKKAYPERFEDVDMVSLTQEYYQNVLSIDLSAEQARKIIGE